MRRWIVVGLAFGLCVAVGLWMTLSRDRANGSTPIVQRRSVDEQPIQQHSSITGEISSDIAAATPESSVAVGTFRGRIIDAVTRAPVREFELKLLRRPPDPRLPEEPPTQTFQDADGRFKWIDAPAGTWKVIVAAPGYQRFALSELNIVKDKATPEVVLPLRRGHKLAGRVFDEGSGVGIGSATIEYREAHVDRYADDWPSREHVRSKENGLFVLEGAPPGRITLTVSADGYAIRERDIVVSDKTSAIEIGLSTGGTIAGYLTAADGVTRIEGTADLLNVADGIQSEPDTSEFGEFAFVHLPEGRYQLIGRARGATVYRDVTLGHNEHMEGIVLALGGGRTVRGTIRGLRPDERGHVHVLLYPEGESRGSSSELDDHSAYAMNGVPPGHAQIKVLFTMRRYLTRTVVVPADSDLTVDFDMPRGLHLSGRVTQGEKVMASARVRARAVLDPESVRYGALTSENGTYEMEGLAAGEYDVRVDDLASRRVKVSGDMVFDIDVPPTRLAARVIEAESAAPVVSAGVHIVGTRRGPQGIRVYDETDHFGQFELAGIESDDILLSVYKPGYEMYRERITGSSPPTDMTIRLREGSGAEIRIHDADDGKPLRDLFVSEQIGATRGIGLPVRLDENGVGALPSALAGSTLSFSVFGYATVVIREWNAEPLELELRRQ